MDVFEIGTLVTNLLLLSLIVPSRVRTLILLLLMLTL